jgi:serine/threonine protein kinase
MQRLILVRFCENGSLHNISKRFGKFPESLVAVYISQVLEGLMYLHDQGVIHRDIKGANILTNKDGTVKLADFGVASNTTSVNDGAVVGSPYWMAPEVIEQSGATTASDIWSVGCVVIELLEGHPPYHTLDPMPALFRIVQDDCPPIPEGASPIVKDFLYHCFQKDVNLRISAKKLLRHPWMAAARRQMAAGKGEPPEKKPSATARPGAGEGPQQRRPLSNYNYDEAVLKVQEWNEALKSPSRPSKHPARATNGRPPSPIREITASPSSSSSGAWKAAPKQPQLAEKIQIPPLSFSLQPPEEQTDNWDDDFEEGISLTKLQGMPLLASRSPSDLLPQRWRNRLRTQTRLARRQRRTPRQSGRTRVPQPNRQSRWRSRRPTRWTISTRTTPISSVGTTRTFSRVRSPTSRLVLPSPPRNRRPYRNAMHGAGFIHSIIDYTLMSPPPPDEELVPPGPVPPGRHQDVRARPLAAGAAVRAEPVRALQPLDI